METSLECQHSGRRFSRDCRFGKHTMGADSRQQGIDGIQISVKAMNVLQNHESISHAIVLPISGECHLGTKMKNAEERRWLSRGISSTPQADQSLCTAEISLFCCMLYEQHSHSSKQRINQHMRYLMTTLPDILSCRVVPASLFPPPPRATAYRSVII